MVRFFYALNRRNLPVLAKTNKGHSLRIKRLKPPDFALYVPLTTKCSFFWAFPAAPIPPLGRVVRYIFTALTKAR